MADKFVEVEWKGEDGEEHSAALSMTDTEGGLYIDGQVVSWVERPYQVLNVVSSINTLTTRLNYLLKPVKQKDE